MSFNASIASLRDFQKRLTTLPTVLAQKVAAAAAPVLTEKQRETFNAHENAYGVGWVPGAEGQVVTLRKTGSSASFLRYVAIGTKIRMSIGTPYFKYQIGKRPVAPAQGAALPTDWLDALNEITVRTARAEMGAP